MACSPFCQPRSVIRYSFRNAAGVEVCAIEHTDPNRLNNASLIAFEQIRSEAFYQAGVRRLVRIDPDGTEVILANHYGQFFSDRETSDPIWKRDEEKTEPLAEQLDAKSETRLRVQLREEFPADDEEEEEDEGEASADQGEDTEDDGEGAAA